MIACLRSTSNPHDELVREAENCGIEAFPCDCKGKIDFSCVSTIRKIIKNNGIDIVHCHDYKADFYGWLAARFTPAKLFATNHLWTKESKKLLCYEFLDGLLMNFFHTVIGVSDAISKEIRSELLVKSKSVTIYNGIDLDKFSSNEKDHKKIICEKFNIPLGHRIIGYVGRLSVQKGLVFLLDAAREIIEAHPNTTFLLVGEGDMRHLLEMRAQKLGISGNVVFAGIGENIQDYYKAFDIFVLPSLREGLPLVLLEALACQLPVVTTKVGAIPSIVKNGEHCFLIEHSCPQSIANSVEDLIENEEKARKLALKGHELVKEKFSARTMAKQYFDLYAQLTK